MAISRHEENDAFRIFVRNRNSSVVDQLVADINKEIEKRIDCTQCGACCRGLMINVTNDEATQLSKHLDMSTSEFKHKYIEVSNGGQFIINTIPCHFLNDNKCTVYENRFNECREFPHLNKNNFADRLFGTLIHYSICPIIFNVIEQLKIELNFFSENKNS